MDKTIANKCRDLAIELVDGIHGFTFEFSSRPHNHQAEYDLVEEKLLELVRAAAPASAYEPAGFVSKLANDLLGRGGPGAMMVAKRRNPTFCYPIFLAPPVPVFASTDTIGAGTVGNIKLGSNCDTARTTKGQADE